MIKSQEYLQVLVRYLSSSYTRQPVWVSLAEQLLQACILPLEHPVHDCTVLGPKHHQGCISSNQQTVLYPLTPECLQSRVWPCHCQAGLGWSCHHDPPPPAPR